MAWRLYPRERKVVPNIEEAGGRRRPLWTFKENLAPTAIQTPDRPACKELLYRLPTDHPKSEDAVK